MKRFALGLALVLGHAALPSAASADDLFERLDRLDRIVGGYEFRDFVHRHDRDRYEHRRDRDCDDDWGRGRYRDDDDDDDDDGDDD